MTLRIPYLLVPLLLLPACGSRRIAGYLEELEGCSASLSETGDETLGSTSTTDSSAETTTTSTTTTDPDTTDTSTATSETTSTTDTTDTSSSTTEAPLPACGNDILEPFAPTPEECDDGNLEPDDGCSETCALDRQVFVTSVVYQAGQLESLNIADALCSNRADDQGLPDPLKYRAWLSDSTTDARDRFDKGRGRLVMVNGLVLATSWSALLAGELENPFEVTEKSETYHGPVWTGTRPDGTAVPDAQHCDDWSTTSFTKTGHYGYSDRTTPEWTLSASDDNPIGCPSSNALYCLRTL